MNMQFAMPDAASSVSPSDKSIGRIVSVTGSKAIVMLDSPKEGGVLRNDRPDMGTLLGIDTANTVVLAIISALSVPVPAQRDGDAEIWIAELGLVGELWRDESGSANLFARGVTVYPALGDRVRVASKSELEAAFCGDFEPLRAHRLHPPGQHHPRHGARRRAARKAPRHPRHHGHRQVLHHRAHLARDPRQEPGGAHRSARSPQRVRDRLQRMGGGHLAPQHAASVLALELRGDRRGSDLGQLTQGRDRDPAGADPHRQGALQRRARTRSAELPTRHDRAVAVHRRHAGALPHLRPHRPHRRAHGQAGEQEGSFALPSASLPHRQHLAGWPLLVHVRLAHRLRRHDAGALAHLPRAGQRQADHHRRADRPADRDHQRGRLGAVAHDLRLRALERGQGAAHTRVRGGPPLRAGDAASSGSSPANARSPRSPRKAASTASRSASSRSGRPRSTRPSSPSATPSSRCACRTTATRRS